MTPLDVLLVEPYFTGSHRSWAEGLAAHSGHRVRLVTHRGRFWKWRMQGGALTLADAVVGAVEAGGRPDVVLVSDMVNVPALLGLARGAVAGVPVVLYMHENQLSYPARDGAEDHTYAMVNWLSLAAADRVVFNSAFHRDDLAGRLPGFLRRFPDHRHGRRVAAVAARSTVLPVGVDVARFPPGGGAGPVPRVLWNHRWEHDKDPAAFFDALARVADAGVAFEVVVAGESYGEVPAEFERGRARLGRRVVHFATASPGDYPGLLAGCDVVVSTARHEFFGLAVAEAVAAGAMPVLPARLSYPELVPGPHPFLYSGAGQLVERLSWALTDADGRRAAAAAARAHIQRFSWEALAPRYDALLSGAASVAGDVLPR